VGFFISPYIYLYMKNLIRRIIKEETNSVDPNKIKVLKNFISDYFSNFDWYRDFDLEIGSFRSMFRNTDIPDIIITIYVSDEVKEINFSDFMDEMEFMMNMLFPSDNKGNLPTALWSMNVEPV